MVEEASLEFRLTKIGKIRNYHLHQNKNNDLMIEKYKKACKNFNHFENLLILSLGITACVSISVFASLICVTVGITRNKNLYSQKGIRKYKSVIKKKNNKHDKIVLLGQDKLNTIEV